jgi:hypothetical protein
VYDETNPQHAWMMLLLGACAPAESIPAGTKSQRPSENSAKRCKTRNPDATSRPLHVRLKPIRIGHAQLASRCHLNARQALLASVSGDNSPGSVNAAGFMNRGFSHSEFTGGECLPRDLHHQHIPFTHAALCCCFQIRLRTNSTSFSSRKNENGGRRRLRIAHLVGEKVFNRGGMRRAEEKQNGHFDSQYEAACDIGNKLALTLRIILIATAIGDFFATALTAARSVRIRHY